MESVQINPISLRYYSGVSQNIDMFFRVEIKHRWTPIRVYQSAVAELEPGISLYQAMGILDVLWKTRDFAGNLVSMDAISSFVLLDQLNNCLVPEMDLSDITLQAGVYYFKFSQISEMYCIYLFYAEYLGGRK